MAKSVEIDEASFDRLQARPQKTADAPHAISVHFDRRNHEIKLVLSSGMTLSFDPWLAPDLYELSDDDLAVVEVEGAGGAIRFPKQDTDLSVPRLLEGFLGPLDWARRERRAEASRQNGKLGGRPRKARANA